jgi:hypothetical protein
VGQFGQRGRSMPKGRMGRLATGPIGLKVEENFFSNKNRIFEYTKAFKICTRRFRKNMDTGIFFLNSSRLLMYFRKMKYAMPCYATLGKN